MVPAWSAVTKLRLPRVRVYAQALTSQADTEGGSQSAWDLDQIQEVTFFYADKVGPT